MIDNTVKFVMFKKSFEDVINSKNLIEIENVNEIKKTPYFRVYPISHSMLMNEGWEYPEGFDSTKGGTFSIGEYIGGRWGGIYLRAPDIFFTILEKGKEKLVKIGDIADVIFGIKTGANEFFYIDDNMQRKWQIEEEFLRPVIKSPKECRSIIIDPKDLKFKVFMCNKSKSELKGTNALKYIEWGENVSIEIKRGSKKGKMIKGYQNLETIKNRRLWYELPKLPSADVLFRQFFNVIFNYPINPQNYLTDHTFYYIHLKNHNEIENFGLILNSTISCLFTELYGRKNMGEGVLTTYGPEIRSIFILDPKHISNKNLEKLQKFYMHDTKSIFEEIGINPSRSIREQEPKPLPDRAELDNIIFDELGLTQEERKEAYWSVCELVKQRLEKVDSLKK